MQIREPKDKPIKVTLKYEPTPDSEERLSEIFELLLSEQSKCQNAVGGKGIGGKRNEEKRFRR